MVWGVSLASQGSREGGAGWEGEERARPPCAGKFRMSRFCHPRPRRALYFGTCGIKTIADNETALPACSEKRTTTMGGVTYIEMNECAGHCDGSRGCHEANVAVGLDGGLCPGLWVCLVG